MYLESFLIKYSKLQTNFNKNINGKFALLEKAKTLLKYTAGILYRTLKQVLGYTNIEIKKRIFKIYFKIFTYYRS